MRSVASSAGVSARVNARVNERPSGWRGQARRATFVALSVGLLSSVALGQPVRVDTVGGVIQRMDFDCGPAALATLIRLQTGRDLSVATLSGAISPAPGEWGQIRARGYSLQQLAQMGRARGHEIAMTAHPARQLGKLSLPLLVHLALPTGAHFSVLTAVAGGQVALLDPSQGAMVWSRAAFLSAWAPAGWGYTLGLTADPVASARAPPYPVMRPPRHE